MSYELLDHLMAIAGEAPAGKDIELIGCDPILPLPFRVGEMGAAVIGAAAVEAARIWEMRGGQRQRIRIDVDAAAVAMRSSRYLKIEPIEGQPEPKVNWNKRGKVGLGVFRTRDDRLIYFQREFEYHRARMDAVLHCEDERESMAAAVRNWDGQDLEEAVIQAGACAGLVRTMDQWRQHPQGQALARLPLFDIVKIGDSLPEALTPSSRPLSGIRVLDLTRVLAGPTAGRALAEHGADVLRISSSKLPDDPAQAIDTGHGKRGADLDLDTEEGMVTLRSLIREADVLSQAFRPRSFDARGLGPEAVAQMRPGIIYLTLSAFGHQGPWSSRRGFDSVVQAVSGIQMANASAEGQPRGFPNPLDYGTGYLAAFGVMVALGRRAREGGSYLVRVSLAQTGRWLQSLPRVADFRELPAELPEGRIASLSTETKSPYGLLRHLAPVAQMSATQPYWERPSVPLSHDRPEWLPR